MIRAWRRLDWLAVWRRCGESAPLRGLAGQRVSGVSLLAWAAIAKPVNYPYNRRGRLQERFK